jgi:ABC-2 type transport system permease protein
MRLVCHSFFMMVRLWRQLLREPWSIAFTLIQPIIWLGLYGQLFKRVVELPGFGASSYIGFLTPGIVAMSTLFASGWIGIGVIQDLDRGIMDRFLISPIQRPAIILGRLLSVSLVIVIQSLILFGLGACLGARYSGGIGGVAILLISAVLLGTPIGALSIAMALLLRKEESIIGAVNFILLPLTFTSTVFMAQNLMPEWMRPVARFNPVNWSVEAARHALQADASAMVILVRLAALGAFAAISAWIATQAFRVYQRSA